MLEEIKNIESSTKKLRQFGLLLIILAAVIGYILHKKGIPGSLYAATFAVICASAVVLCPALLKPFYIVWMGLAAVLGWCMTGIIMILLFYLVLVPIKLTARICGKTFFPAGPDSSAGTYWVDRSEVDFTKDYYEKQF